MTRPIITIVLITSLFAACKHTLANIKYRTKPKVSLYIDGCSFGTGLGTAEYFLSMTFYIVNNTDVPKKYVGAFFSSSKLYLSDNKNLTQLQFGKADAEEFRPIVIAPHRAVKAYASFGFIKTPDTTFSFKFGMRLIPTKEKGYFHHIADSSFKKAKIVWSDKIVFKTDRKHSVPELSETEYKQRILNRPLVDYHVLTAEDRKKYVLSVNQKSISPIRDTLLPNFQEKHTYKQSYITVPVELTNHSSDTLRYVNMICSTEDIFKSNNVRLAFFQSFCFGNYPTDYKIAPHGSQIFNFLCTVNKQKGTDNNFKIGMSLQKIDHESWEFNLLNMLLRPETSNLIWSNEVHIP